MKLFDSRVIWNLGFVLMGMSLMVMGKWYFRLITTLLIGYIIIKDGKRWKRGE